MPKLELPEGAKTGSVLAITWPESDPDRIISGTYEGRLLNVGQGKIVVHFMYEPDADPSEEQIAIDLESGMDLKYHVPVTDIQLVGPRQSPMGAAS